jgi:hypothetical protein
MEEMGSLSVAKKRTNTFNDSCPTEISQDRRSKRRYPIELPLHYKIVKNCLTLGVGKGSSIDVSSRGIAFKSDAPLGVGSYLEVSISWPALLNESCALKLMVSGRGCSQPRKRYCHERRSIRIPHRRGKGVSASRGSTTTFDSDAPVNTTSAQSSSEGSSLLRGIVRCNGAEASHLAMFGLAIVLIRFARQRPTLQPTTIAICIFPETKNIS